MVSVAMFSFDLSGMIFAFMHARLIRKLGKKNAITLGFIIGVASIVAMGPLKYYKPDEWKPFLALSILCRFLSGIGDSLIQTVIFSTIPQVFPEQKEKYIGFNNVALGLGLLVGPTMAAPLYAYFGFDNTFYVFGAISLLATIIHLFFVPARLNSSA